MVAPEAGIEPATRRLTVACSTAELLRKNSVARPAVRRPARRRLVAERSPGGKCTMRGRPRGGLGRNRTGIDGFAVRYIATLPPGRRAERRCYTHGVQARSSAGRDAGAFDALGRRCL